MVAHKRWEFFIEKLVVQIQRSSHVIASQVMVFQPIQQACVLWSLNSLSYHALCYIAMLILYEDVSQSHQWVIAGLLCLSDSFVNPPQGQEAVYDIFCTPCLAADTQKCFIVQCVCFQVQQETTKRPFTPIIITYFWKDVTNPTCDSPAFLCCRMLHQDIRRILTNADPAAFYVELIDVKE